MGADVRVPVEDAAVGSSFRFPFRFVATALACVFVMTGAVRASADDVVVAVAANFADATRAIVPLFEKATGHRVRVSFGSTGMLFSQIENGAPFEVFLAADAARPAKAEDEGLAVPNTRFTYARGRLVLWSPDAGAFHDGEAYVRTLAFRRAAIANPALAPYGLAARQVMEHLGVWERARPRLVLGEDIAQAFQFVATENADAGFVALAQVKAWKGDPGALWEIPKSFYVPIDQQAVLLKKGEAHPAARAFLEFLKSPAARRVITGDGYGVE